MKKLITALTISICLLLVTPLSIVSTFSSTTQTVVTKQLWSTPINGTAVALEIIPDINDDGHEDVLVVSEDDGSGYIALIDGGNGVTIRQCNLDFEPTEVLYVSVSDSIAIAKKTGGVGVYDTQLNLEFSIPAYHPYALMYENSAFYYLGIWMKNQSDYGINPKELYPTNPFGKTEQYGYVDEAPVELMQNLSEMEPEECPLFLPNPWPYMLDVKLNMTPTPFEVAPTSLQTFDGTDLVYLDGYCAIFGNNTHFVSHSINNGSLNWISGGQTANVLRVDNITGYEYLPGGGTGTGFSGTWIFASTWTINDFKVLSPTRGVGHMRTIGVPGCNFSRHSSEGEWPLILVDNNGGRVEQYTICHKAGIGIGDHCWYMTCVENATYEKHYVSPITPYDETHFLITVTEIGVSTVLMLYSIAEDTFTITWKIPVDLAEMNVGFPTADLNNNGKKGILAVSDGKVAVFSGDDGSKLYGTDIATFVIVDVASLSLGDVILTNEGYGCLISFGGSNHTTYWKEFLGSAWETFISPLQDVDGDDYTDLAVASGNSVTCYWGYYENPPPLPIQNQLWFWAMIAIVADASVIGLVVFARKRARAN
jgi:hypothetical protein